MIRASYLAAATLLVSSSAFAATDTPYGTDGPLLANPAFAEPLLPKPGPANPNPTKPAAAKPTTATQTAKPASKTAPRTVAKAAAAGPTAAKKIAPGTTSPVKPASVTDLAGRWTGNGTLRMASGQPISFRCTMTYRPTADGRELKQQLRCRGAENNFDAATHLMISGPNVTGRWQDNVYSLNGTVRGSTTGDTLDLDFDGQFFQAKMLVQSTGCAQTVRLVPRDRSAMLEISADLRRC